MFGVTKRIALIVLSVWLILTGIFAVADIGLSRAGLILNVLAIIPGGLILLEAEKWSAKIGMILLGSWLVARGLEAVVDLSFQGLETVLAIVAVAAGALILLER